MVNDAVISACPHHDSNRRTTFKKRNSICQELGSLFLKISSFSPCSEYHSSGSFKLTPLVNTENTTPLEGIIFYTHKHHGYVFPLKAATGVEWGCALQFVVDVFKLGCELCEVSKISIVSWREIWRGWGKICQVQEFRDRSGKKKNYTHYTFTKWIQLIV